MVVEQGPNGVAVAGHSVARASRLAGARAAAVAVQRPGKLDHPTMGTGIPGIGAEDPLPRPSCAWIIAPAGQAVCPHLSVEGVAPVPVKAAEGRSGPRQQGLDNRVTRRA